MPARQWCPPGVEHIANDIGLASSSRSCKAPYAICCRSVCCTGGAQRPSLCCCQGTTEAGMACSTVPLPLCCSLEVDLKDLDSHVLTCMSALWFLPFLGPLGRNSSNFLADLASFCSPNFCCWGSLLCCVTLSSRWCLCRAPKHCHGLQHAIHTQPALRKSDLPVEGGASCNVPAEPATVPVVRASSIWSIDLFRVIAFDGPAACTKEGVFLLLTGSASITHSCHLGTSNALESTVTDVGPPSSAWPSGILAGRAGWTGPSQ